MRIIGNILKAAGISILVILLGTLIFLAAIWFRPELLLNEKRARQALHWAPSGTEVSWDSFSWRFHPEGTWAKRSDLTIKGLCFRIGTAISGCVPGLRLDFSFSLRGFHPRITQIGALRAEVNFLHYRPLPSIAGPASGHSPLPDLRLPSFSAIFPADLDPARPTELRIAVRSFTIEQAEAPNLNGHFLLEKTAGLPSAAFFSLNGSVSQGDKNTLHLAGKGQIAAAERKLILQGSMRGKVNGWRLRLPFEMAWNEQIAFKGYLSTIKQKAHLSIPFSIAWQQNQISGEWGKIEFAKLLPNKSFHIDSCNFTSRLDRKQGFPQNNSLQCNATLASFPGGMLLPPLKARIAAELSLKPLPNGAIATNFHFTELGKNAYFESDINFSAAANIAGEKLEFEGVPELKLSATLGVPALEAWKRVLDSTPFAIPAPLRTLTGPVNLVLRLDKALPESLTLQAELRSDLHGPKQALVTKSDARIKLSNPWEGNRSLSIDSEAELTDVALEAPPLRLEEPPQFLPDKRFFATHAGAETAKSRTIPLDWRLHLISKNPVRIHTNLLQDAVPVALDLKLARNTDMDGTITIQPMRISVFRKRAELKTVKLSFHTHSPVGEVSGLLEHHNPEVLIKILLLGSTERPRVEFESDPPLSRQQIVSVLLFNKSIGQLTEEEASSTGSLSQATADGALGLFSLLFLASTPVESIGYDPVSQTYSARVRLGDKTTISVGSDFDRERAVALRRRLGGRWAIRTELHNQEGGPDVLLTLLEWFKRF